MRIALLLIMTVMAVTATASPATIRVDGAGVISVTPDHAIMGFEVAQTAQSAATAQEEVERRVTDITAGIDAFAIEPDTLRATHLSVDPQYRWQPDRRERIFEGYRVARRVTFTLNDLQQLGAVYQQLIERGATTVEPARLDSRERTALERAALARAYDDARAQARAIATAAGKSLGEPLDIDAAPTGPISNPLVTRMAAAEATQGEVYLPGKLEIRRRLTAVFSLSAP